MTLPPAASELAAACADLVTPWHLRAPLLDWDAVTVAFRPRGDDWTDLALDLCLVNCFQWHLEDECRVQYDEPHALAALKRDIDDSNYRRVLRIDAIDERIAHHLGDDGAGAGSGPVALVTPGNLLDRISILELKRYHAGPRQPVADVLREQLDDACEGFDRLIADLASSRQTLKRYRTVKLYGATDVCLPM